MVWATSSPQPLERWPGDTAGTASTCPICRQSARSKQPERVQPRLTGPEFHALVQALGSRLLRKRTPRFLIARDTAILQVLVETGLRAAELCALNVGDIDFQEGSVMVRCGKGRKDRAINILDPDPNETDGGTAPRALADYLSYREKMDGVVLEPALWLTPKGNRLNPNVLRAVLRKLCRDAGLSGNRPPHAFRRGWFTASYQADPNALPVLSARMGWSSTSSMARVYTRGAQVDLARTTARPSMSKTWRQAAEAREAPPRPKPAPVQRQQNLQALLGFIQGDPAMRRALLQALGAWRHEVAHPSERVASGRLPLPQSVAETLSHYRGYEELFIHYLAEQNLPLVLNSLNAGNVRAAAEWLGTRGTGGKRDGQCARQDSSPHSSSGAATWSARTCSSTTCWRACHVPRQSKSHGAHSTVGSPGAARGDG